LVGLSGAGPQTTMATVTSAPAETSFSTSSSDANHSSTVEPGESDDGANDIVQQSQQQEKLVVWQGIALLTADCMGVGILGLPNDMKVLGWAIGLSFLVLNCPINYYAGNLLSILALEIEQDINDDEDDVDKNQQSTTEIELAATKNTAVRRKRNKRYEGLPQNQQEEGPPSSEGGDDHDESYDVTIEDNDDQFTKEAFRDEFGNDPDDDDGIDQIATATTGQNHDRKTSDLINMTAAVFATDSFTSRSWIFLVKTIYYINLFLVLGDYILVMGRSVAAFFGEDNICLPTAGAIASVFMFGLCQFRTMANIGRSVSLASLLALLIVLVQCLFHHHHRNDNNNVYIHTDSFDGNSTDIYTNSTDIPPTRILQDNADDDGVWGKFSSLAGIGFAVGSQKLFLNIRHELQDRNKASKVLGGSLLTYGTAYVGVVLLAGSDPPSFLFDAIPEGWGRRMAGLLLWFHVAVSYAINSQALCASIDHNMGMATTTANGTRAKLRNHPAVRWFVITLMVSVSSYLVSNSVPFFKDLVALIGALTSVPLSLTLPAILWRRARSITLLLPSCKGTGSYLLLWYSFAFLAVGLIGALTEIDEDWLSQGKPFACHEEE